MTECFDYRGRTVFVAGGSSGINLAIAEAFVAHGAAVCIASRSRQRLDAALERLRKVSPDKTPAQQGGRAKHTLLAAADDGTANVSARVAAHVADVREPDAVEAALKACHDRFGAIDVLVSGAAGNFVAPALGMSPKGFRTVVDIDLVGSFNVLRLAHAYLRKPGAAVINISAPQAANPTRYQAHVCAAKAGIDMLTRVLAMEWGADGIRINSIIPGPIGDTEGVARLAPSAEALAAMAASIPLGRFGSTADVANMALFLASPLAAFVTGALIPVDGGSSLGGGRDLGAALK